MAKARGPGLGSLVTTEIFSHFTFGFSLDFFNWKKFILLLFCCCYTKLHKSTVCPPSCLYPCREEKEVEDSNSSSGDSDEEPVTSTVPELVDMEIPEDIKTDHTSWLHRRSRTPSPSKSDNPLEVGEARGQQGKRGVAGPVAGNKNGVPPVRQPQSYKPVLVNRKDNEVESEG